MGNKPRIKKMMDLTRLAVSIVPAARTMRGSFLPKTMITQCGRAPQATQFRFRNYLSTRH
jgi:hypothetical protein